MDWFSLATNMVNLSASIFTQLNRTEPLTEEQEAAWKAKFDQLTKQAHWQVDSDPVVTDDNKTV